MSFGEKLFMLRKEKGFSQEELAEKINTTRQAVSRWENNQGFPETEKLMVLGNIFDVTIDYLLKDNTTLNERSSNGYYVSQEKAELWILHEEQNIKKLATGIAFLICSGIPFLLFQNYFPVALFLGISFILIGLVFIFKICLVDNDYEFKVLKQNELSFDNTFYEKLKNRYLELKKKYIIMMVSLPVTIIIGIAIFIIARQYHETVIIMIIPVILFMISIGIFMFLYGSTMKDAYELLVCND